MFTDANSRKVDGMYWTRSTDRRSSHSFCCIDNDGYLGATGAGNQCNVVIFFSI